MYSMLGWRMAGTREGDGRQRLFMCIYYCPGCGGDRSLSFPPTPSICFSGQGEYKETRIVCGIHDVGYRQEIGKSFAKKNKITCVAPQVGSKRHLVIRESLLLRYNWCRQILEAEHTYKLEILMKNMNVDVVLVSNNLKGCDDKNATSCVFCYILMPHTPSSRFGGQGAIY